MLRIIYFLATFVAINTNSARILGVIPNHARSHQQAHLPIFKELAKRGHDLVLLTTVPVNDPSLPNIKEITWHGTYEAMANVPNIKEIYMDTSVCGLKSAALLGYQLNEIHKWQLEDERVQDLINNHTEHFDLVMLEFFSPVMFAFKHRFNAPFIGLASMDMLNVYHRVIGNPVHHILYPDRIFSFQGDMPFYARILAFVYDHIINLFPAFIHSDENLSVRKYFGGGYPGVEDLEKNVDMLFINSNPAYYDNRPFTPATVNIHGLHIRKPKPLPEILRRFFDESKRGVIYFSLGSNVNDKFLSLDLQNLIKNVFRELPYDILWKYDSSTMEDKPKNILIEKWVPQQDVLAHSNLKLFITQCGLQSLEEGLINQVPMLGFPIMFDQWINSNFLAKRGFGIALDYRKLTFIEFRNAIISVIINSTSHKANLKKWSDIVLDTPNTSLERAVFWTEYVIRHNGSQHLKGTNDLPTYQYYYLDVIFCLLVIFAVFILLIYFILRLLIKSCYSKPKEVKSKTN